MLKKILGTIGIILLTPLMLLGILLIVMGFVEKIYSMEFFGIPLFSSSIYCLVLIKIKCFPTPPKDTKPKPKPKSKVKTVIPSPKIDFSFLKFRKPSFSFNKHKYRVSSFEKERIKEVKQKVRSSIPSPRGLTPNEIYFLSYAPKFTTTQTDFQKFWLLDMGIDDPRKLLDRFESLGYIKPASAAESLASLKVAELKEMLTELRIPATGKKSDLIERLCSIAPQDYLDNKVPIRNYVISDLGNQELDENEYVVYFGKSNKFGYDVWGMNKALQNNPSCTFRDIIWKRLNRDMKSAISSKSNGDYFQYTPLLFEVGNYLLEIECYSEALRYIAEGTYYQITVDAVERYRKEIDDHKHFGGTVLGFGYGCRVNKSAFKSIKNGLDISNEEMYIRLVELFSEFDIPQTANCAYIPNDVLTDEDVAGIIMFTLDDNEEAVNGLFAKAEHNLKKCKLPVHYFNFT